MFPGVALPERALSASVILDLLQDSILSGQLTRWILYVFSILGFFLIPSALGRWTWVVPGGFAGLNLFLFIAPEFLQPRQDVVIYLLLSQAPWILFCADLVFRGRIARVVEQVPVRSWIALPIFRFLGVGFFFMAYTGDLPPDFAIHFSFGELVTALGALLLWILFRPANLWYRSLLFFWNAYGLMAALMLSWVLLRSHPGFSSGQPSFDIHGYFAGYPQVWIPLFWIPLSICAHASVFFKLYSESKSTHTQASKDAVSETTWT